MAGETLLTIDEMLDSFPTNTQGLITALDSRSMIVSECVNVGYLVEDNAPGFTVPITDGVWVPVNPQIISPVFVGNYWKIDANNAFLPSYVDKGVTVNPNTNRLTGIRFGARVSKVGGGTAMYSFAFFKSGVQIGSTPAEFEIGTSEQGIASSRDLIQDMALSSEQIDLRVRGEGTGDDLNVLEFTMRATGAPL